MDKFRSFWWMQWWKKWVWMDAGWKQLTYKLSFLQNIALINWKQHQQKQRHFSLHVSYRFDNASRDLRRCPCGPRPPPPAPLCCSSHWWKTLERCDCRTPLRCRSTGTEDRKQLSAKNMRQLDWEKGNWDSLRISASSKWLKIFCVFPISSHHDQIHERHGIEADVPQPHDAEHVDQDHADGDADDHGRPQLKAQQHRGHHEYGCQRQAQVQRRVVRDGQVLLVEHVEYAAKRERECTWAGRFVGLSRVLKNKNKVMNFFLLEDIRAIICNLFLAVTHYY